MDHLEEMRMHPEMIRRIRDRERLLGRRLNFSEWVAISNEFPHSMWGSHEYCIKELERRMGR